jgi:hypothetical protein
MNPEKIAARSITVRQRQDANLHSIADLFLRASFPTNEVPVKISQVGL